MNLSFEEKINDDGIFKFNDNGFSFTINEITTEKNWNEIEEINVYKRDLMTTDLICMDINFKETSLTFSEETQGWYILVKKLKEVFNTIPSDWNDKVVVPPFETNFKTIYKKG